MLRSSCRWSCVHRRGRCIVQALPNKSDRWKAASADMSATAIVPALGWFESAPSDKNDTLPSTDRDSLWLVLKFEGLAPAQGFARPMPLAERQEGFRLFATKEKLPVARRCRYLRALFSGALQIGLFLSEIFCNLWRYCRIRARPLFRCARAFCARWRRCCEYHGHNNRSVPARPFSGCARVVLRPLVR